MPSQRTAGKQVGGGTAPVNATETVCFVTDPLSVSGVAGHIRITAIGGITTGAGTNALTVRCRRGNGITGTQVGTDLTQVIGAAVSGVWVGEWDDAPGEVAGQVYSICLVQNAGAGVGASFGNQWQANID